MTDTVPSIQIRERLKDLNTKAYYLLVHLASSTERVLNHGH